MRKLTAILAALLLSTQLISCTSSDSHEDESGEEAVAEESTEAVDGELEQLDAPADENAVASSDSANEGFLDEQLPEDALGESKQAATDTPPADIAENTTPPPAPEETPLESPTDSFAAVDTGSAPTETSPVTESPEGSSIGSVSSSEPAMTEEAKPVEAKPKVSLKKVETTPFSRDGVLLNAVYIARPGDNYKKISTLIYGNDEKSKELKKLNPGVRPRVGDKIYYNSPLRAADDTKVLNYYEDRGLINEVYIAKEGDNIRQVGKKILGHKDSWKELWATNGIDSKDILPAGTELRYWKTEVASAPPVADIAMNDAAPAPEMAAPPVNEFAPPPPAELPPPPSMDMAPPPPAELPPPPVAELPPPPPPVEMAPPPPPPPVEAINPPPPPPVAKKSPTMDEQAMEPDMMMMLGGVGLIAAGLAAVIIIRKRRQNKEMAAAFNDTQVGT